MSSLGGSSGVFISYRRDDTAANAGRLYDHLSNHFGEVNVFMDIDTIAPGRDFAEAIRDAVSQCSVMFVLMGRKWLGITDDSGRRRRLDNPGDFVRLEIETALRRDILVVPVLIDGAELPMVKDLPLSLQPLMKYQALQLTSIGFRSQVARLLVVVEQTGIPVSPSQASFTSWHLELLHDEGAEKKTFRLWSARESHEISFRVGGMLTNGVFEIDGAVVAMTSTDHSRTSLPRERTGLGFDLIIEVDTKWFRPGLKYIKVEVDGQVLRYNV